MAYTPADLQAVGAQPGNSPTLWSYTTVDTQADVNTSGYFNDASAILSVGDLIYGYVDSDGTPAAVLFYVLSNASGVVDVNDGTVLAATDSD